MPVTDVNKDLDALTMKITAEFDAGSASKTASPTTRASPTRRCRR